MIYDKLVAMNMNMTKYLYINIYSKYKHLHAQALRRHRSMEPAKPINVYLIWSRAARHGHWTDVTR